MIYFLVFGVRKFDYIKILSNWTVMTLHFREAMSNCNWKATRPGPPAALRWLRLHLYLRVLKLVRHPGRIPVVRGVWAAVRVVAAAVAVAVRSAVRHAAHRSRQVMRRVHHPPRVPADRRGAQVDRVHGGKRRRKRRAIGRPRDGRWRQQSRALLVLHQMADVAPTGKTQSID